MKASKTVTLFCLVFYLTTFLSSCGSIHSGNPLHSGIPYLDIPSSVSVDDGTVSVGNDGLKRFEVFSLGMGIQNKGSDAITLDSLVPLNIPKNVKIVAVTMERPQENKYILLAAGGLGYPPRLERAQKYILHPIHNAIVVPGEYVESVVSLAGTAKGAFVIKGFRLTLVINGQIYQHIFPEAVVLCVEVNNILCQQAYKSVG